MIELNEIMDRIIYIYIYRPVTMSSLDQVFIPCIVMYMEEEEKRRRGGQVHTHIRSILRGRLFDNFICIIDINKPWLTLRLPIILLC